MSSLLSTAPNKTVQATPMNAAVFRLEISGLVYGTGTGCLTFFVRSE